MHLHAERMVAAPVDRTWQQLLDLDVLAAGIPGTTLEPAGADGVRRGSVRVTHGRRPVEFRGSARIEEVDEDEHMTAVAVRGREVGGDAAVSARIASTLVPDSGGVRLHVDVELHLSGNSVDDATREAANRRLEEFVSELRRGLLAGSATPPVSAETRWSARRRVAVAGGLAVGAAAVALLVRRLVARRRRGGAR